MNVKIEMKIIKMNINTYQYNINGNIDILK